MPRHGVELGGVGSITGTPDREEGRSGGADRGHVQREAGGGGGDLAVVALAVSVGVRAFAVESVVGDGSSMAPSFASGDLVAVNKMTDALSAISCCVGSARRRTGSACETAVRSMWRTSGARTVRGEIRPTRSVLP